MNGNSFKMLPGAISHIERANIYITLSFLLNTNNYDVVSASKHIHSVYVADKNEKMKQMMSTFIETYEETGCLASSSRKAFGNVKDVEYACLSSEKLSSPELISKALEVASQIILNNLRK